MDNQRVLDNDSINRDGSQIMDPVQVNDLVDASDQIIDDKHISNEMKKRQKVMELVQNLRDETNQAGPSGSKRKPPIQWVQRHSFTMKNEEWRDIHEENNLIKGKYTEPFIRIINSFDHMSCVLRSNGYNKARNQFVIRFQCVHPECNREYQVQQIEDNNFVIYDNDAEVVHVAKRTRQVRGSEREAVKKQLLTQHPTTYKKQTEGYVDVNLLKLGNLPDDDTNDPGVDDGNPDFRPNDDSDKREVIDDLI